MPSQIFIRSPLLIVGIILPLFFLYPNFKKYTYMEFKTKEIEVLEKIPEMTEWFKADFKGKKIAYAFLKPEHQALHDNMEKLDSLVKNHLGNATIKPQADGVSLKKKADIGKHQFIQFVEQWVGDFKEKLAKLDNKITTISISAVSDFLKFKIGDKKFPVSLIFWQHIDKELKDLGEKNTPKNIADAIVRALDGVQLDLAAEFVNNKPIYKKIKKEDLAAVTKNQDIQKIIIAPIELCDWIIEKAEAESKASVVDIEKTKAEAERAFAEYIANLTAAIHNTEINNPNALPDTIYIDLNLFFAKHQMLKKKGGPMIDAIEGYLKARFGGAKFTTLEDMRTAFDSWFDLELFKEPWVSEQYEFWQQDKMVFSNYPRIAAAVSTACIDIDADTIYSKITVWTSSVRSAFIFEAGFPIDKEKAKKNLMDLFEETSSTGISLNFVYSTFISKYLDKTTAKTSTKELQEKVWNPVLSDLVKRGGKTDMATVDGLFTEWLGKFGPYSLKQFNQELDTILPSKEEIQDALRNSRWQEKKLIIPEIEKSSLNPIVEIKSKMYLKNETFQGRALMNLEYKALTMALGDKNAKLEDVLMAVPNSIDWVLEKNASQAEIKLIKHKIKKPFWFGTAYCTPIELKFMVVADSQALFNALNVDSWDKALKKLDGLTGIDIENFIDKSSKTYFVDFVLTVQSAVEDKNKSNISVQIQLENKTPDWEAVFEGNSSVLGKLNLHPKYEYK